MNERDPNGKDPHGGGAKLDAGKNRLGLVLLGFSKALREVGKVGTYGAAKYTDNGWVDVPDGIARYTDAMLRHTLVDEPNDPDTGLAHAAHAAWNALARLDLMLRKAEGVEAIDGLADCLKANGFIPCSPSEVLATMTPSIDELVRRELMTNIDESMRNKWGEIS